jgi:hypothetical protein
MNEEILSWYFHNVKVTLQEIITFLCFMEKYLLIKEYSSYRPIDSWFETIVVRGSSKII